MARIKYINESGEHNGILTPAEYYIYSYDGDGAVLLEPNDRIPCFSWHNTDYEPFKRAVNKKYNTTCERAWLV